MSVESAPATQAAAVTPSDSTIVSCRALFVGTGGNVAVHMLGNAASPGGTSVTFSNVPSGSILPVSCYRVLSTGTTASNIVALY
jgi:hypothetical protein